MKHRVFGPLVANEACTLTSSPPLPKGTRSFTASRRSPPTRCCDWSHALGLTDMFFVHRRAHYDAEVIREKLATELGAIERIA